MSADEVDTRKDVVFNEIDFRVFKQADEDVSISPELLNVSGDKMTESESQLEAVPRRSRQVIQRPDYYGYSESTDATTTAYEDTVMPVKHYAYNVKRYLSQKQWKKHSVVHMQENENWRLIRSINRSSRTIPRIW